MRAIACVMLGAWMLVSGGARATVFTDLWWNPAEPGWGVNVVQQQDAMFMTFFVYAADGSARWYAGTVYAGVALPSGYPRYDGDLYESRGSPPGGVFDTAAFAARKVGTINFSASSFATATLSYSIDGVNIVRPLFRQAFRHIGLGGSYFGGFSVKSSSCATIAVGSYGTLDMQVAATVGSNGVNGSVTTVVSLDAGPPCAVTGTYTQAGSLYQIEQTPACSASQIQFFYTDVSSTDDGIDGNMQLRYPTGCTTSMSFSAVRR